MKSSTHAPVNRVAGFLRWGLPLCVCLLLLAAAALSATHVPVVHGTVALSVDKATAIAGDTLVYTVRLSNATGAGTVAVSLNIPQHTTFSGGTGCSPVGGDGKKVQCTLAVGAGGTATA